nr:hypothetical protein [Fodinicola feengrottensis]
MSAATLRSSGAASAPVPSAVIGTAVSRPIEPAGSASISRGKLKTASWTLESYASSYGRAKS